MSSFKMRTSKPENGNKYYNTKSNGGYSDAIKGNSKHRDAGCDVLPNCVGYAYGRFNEIGEYGCCKYLRPTNAENFIQYRGKLKYGMEPKVGSCMVWQKGDTLSGDDGAGHVAIVEKVIGPGEVYTSESGWSSSKPFWNQIRRKGDGNWGQNNKYKFLGFIYNPAVDDDCKIENNDKVVNVNIKVLRKGMRNSTVKCLQALLIGYGYEMTNNGVKYGVDGSFGKATYNAVIAYQKANGLAIDGVVGPNTWKKLLGL